MLDLRKCSLIILFYLSFYQPKAIYNNHLVKYNYSYNTSSKLNDIVLTIDKINLRVAFNDNSKLKDGPEIHNVSKIKGNPLIIMGHSGFGSNVYFNDLDSLEKKDLITISKNSGVISYEVIDLLYFDKGSKIKLPMDNSYIYLVTCDKYNLNKQLIISAKMAKNAKI